MPTKPPREFPQLRFPNTKALPPEEGRILIHLQIDKSGKVDSPKILQAEASPTLQKAVLDLVQRGKIVTTHPFDAPDPTPFDVTVRVCENACTSILPFPNSEDVMITWAGYHRKE